MIRGLTRRHRPPIPVIVWLSRIPFDVPGIHCGPSGPAPILKGCATRLESVHCTLVLGWPNAALASHAPDSFSPPHRCATDYVRRIERHSQLECSCAHRRPARSASGPGDELCTGDRYQCIGRYLCLIDSPPTLWLNRSCAPGWGESGACGEQIVTREFAMTGLEQASECSRRELHRRQRGLNPAGRKSGLRALIGQATSQLESDQCQKRSTQAAAASLVPRP